MSKENVREYIRYLYDMGNTPLYEHQTDGIKEHILELERKLTLREMSDIKFLCDIDICEKYGLEPRELNQKYVGYVTDKKDKIIEEKIGKVTVVTECEVMTSRMKTDFIQMRDDLLNQIEKLELLK